MQSILEAPIVRELCRTCSDMYARGWDERNAGNISVMIEESDISPYLDPDKVIRRIPIGFREPFLAERYFIVTATGKYFRNVEIDPAASLGIFRISEDAEHAELLWGYTDGGSFTSELPAHLMSHAARLSVDPGNRVVMHCHPDHLLAMTYVHDLDEREFTRSLWRMESECIVVFPEGVGVLPWMVYGTNEIGRATADKMKTARLVVWAHHGIYSAGADLDETYGLIETAEKAARIYMMTAQLQIRQTITDEDLHRMEERFGIKARAGYLD